MVLPPWKKLSMKNHVLWSFQSGNVEIGAPGLFSPWTWLNDSVNLIHYLRSLGISPLLFPRNALHKSGIS
jgi:hypothetical protein